MYIYTLLDIIDLSFENQIQCYLVTVAKQSEMPFCISLADRSFNDLSQYPVMPWVIQDYTSAQIGKRANSVLIYRHLI